MGFFSNIKNRARGMPMAPQPMQELRAGQIMPNSPQVGRSSSPSRMPAPPARFDRATAPVLNPGNIGGNLGSDFRAPQIEDMRFRGRAPQKKGGLGGLFRKLQEQIKNQQRPQQMPQQNLDFLSRLPQNMMPQVDFSNIPQLPENFKFNPQMGQMTPGYAVGGPLMGRAANLSRQVLNKNRMGRDLPERATSNIGDMVMGGRGASPFTDSLRRGTENAIIAGGAGGAALLADGTQMFREPFSKENTRSFMSPEAFGKDMAQMRMDVGAVINFARNKANEIGADINDYVSRAKSAYDQQMNQDMEDQRMQELDAQQGMQPFSALLGPDMPLRRPELTEGRTTSDIDDILSSLEKKN
jgi:Sec-independent protein translocase protein TatA